MKIFCTNVFAGLPEAVTVMTRNYRTSFVKGFLLITEYNFVNKLSGFFTNYTLKLFTRYSTTLLFLMKREILSSRAFFFQCSLSCTHWNVFTCHLQKPQYMQRSYLPSLFSPFNTMLQGNVNRKQFHRIDTLHYFLDFTMLCLDLMPIYQLIFKF